VLSFGSPMEMETAEYAILEVARHPSGVQHLQQAGLVQVIVSMFVMQELAYSRRRALHLAISVAGCAEAVEDLMQPPFIDAFGSCLTDGFPETQLQACKALYSLLSQCIGQARGRARRLVPLLVFLAREAPSAELRRSAARCLGLFVKQKGCKELMAAAGAIATVMKLITDESDVESCRHGLHLMHNLAMDHPKIAQSFVDQGKATPRSSMPEPPCFQWPPNPLG